MMGNKWVQASILLGVAVGLFVGMFLSALHYAIPYLASVVAGLAALYVSSGARGTDGWGGPYNGP